MTADRTHRHDFNKIIEKHGKAEGESVHQKLLADSNFSLKKNESELWKIGSVNWFVYTNSHGLFTRTLVV